MGTLTSSLARTTPEAQGISTTAVLGFLDAVERDVRDLHSFILARHGAVVAEGYWDPYGPSYPHMLFSLSKSFTSTAVGLLVAEGRLSVDDSVLGYFADEAPARPSDNLRAMTVRHLLTMTTGHATEPLQGLRDTSHTWARAFLEHPIEHPPGSHFLYNSLATYMLSAIVQRITGERMIRYLEPRLFAPLGIEHPTWETSPEGIDVGGWGLSITTPDIARFGQLYLQRGVWQGQRLLPESWVAEATAWQVPNGPAQNPDWGQGYGYQFWRCRHGAYRGDGAFGQFCVVMPEQEAVLAVTSGLRNMQQVLDLAWEHLLPAMSAGPVPEDAGARSALAARLDGLRLAPTAGQPGSVVAAGVSNREFTLDENPFEIVAVRFDFGANGVTLHLRGTAAEERIPCGFGRWERSESRLLRPRARRESPSPEKLAASGAWVDDRTYAIDLCWYETPFRHTLTCRFDGDALSIDLEQNVGFGPTELPRLVGRAAAPAPESG